MDLSQTIQQMSALGAIGFTWAVNFLPRLATALGMLVVGYGLAKWADAGLRKLLARGKHIDATLWPAIASAARYGILIVVAVAALGQLGIETTSILAIIGAAALALGLALQGTLSNIAAGLMLLWLRPFRAGDTIESASATGTVRELGLLATRIDTLDGVFRFVPNAELWNKPVSNFTRNPTRMVDLIIPVSYDADIREARRILLDLARSDARIVAAPEPEVFVDRLADSAVVLRYRLWVHTADFLAAQRALLEEAKRRLDAAAIVIPYPQQVVHYADALHTRAA